METKICKRCEEEKNINCFDFTYKTLNKEIKTLKASCKICLKLYNKKYAKDNKDRKLYLQRVWRENNPDKVKENRRKSYIRNKEYELDSHRKYVIENKEKISTYNKNFKIKNKDILNKKRVKRFNEDRIYKLSTIIRNSIKSSFIKSGYSKKSKTYEILGVSSDEFRIYLESKFESWMSWDNHGKYNGEFNYGWDIDHILPLSSAKSEEELYKLNHYTNLQPLCSKINRDIKKGKLIW